MDEIGALLEKAHQRLQAARDLFRLQHYEDCANRAYYSMALAATAALRYKEIVTKTHKGLHMRFSEEFIRTGDVEARYGKEFRYAEDLRNKVDYQSFETISKVPKG